MVEENKDNWDYHNMDEVLKRLKVPESEIIRIKNMNLFEQKRYMEEIFQLVKRSLELERKQMKRVMKELVGMIMVVIGMFMGAITLFGTLFCLAFQVIGMFQIPHWWISYFKGIMSLSFVLFLSGYVLYRKYKPRNEDDILKHAWKKTWEKME